MLLFKKKFLPAIRAGTKTQTIRFWKRRRLRAGQASYIPGAGRIVIESIETIEVHQLTVEDALRDGFGSLEELHAEIRSLYPQGLPEGFHPYRIVFRLTETGTAA